MYINSTCTYIPMYININLSIHINIHAYVHVHTYKYKHINIHLHINICIYTCSYTYILPIFLNLITHPDSIAISSNYCYVISCIVLLRYYNSHLFFRTRYNITNSLKRDADSDNLHTMSVIIDMKRQSPTIPSSRNIVEFANAAKFAELLTLTGVDGLFVNTDELEYGGNFNDLKECVRAVKLKKPKLAPACICKDIIIHPVQVSKFLIFFSFSLHHSI